MYSDLFTSLLLILSGLTPRSGFTRLHSNSIFNFLRDRSATLLFLSGVCFLWIIFKQKECKHVTRKFIHESKIEMK